MSSRFRPLLPARLAAKPLGPRRTATDPTPGTYAKETATDAYPGRRPPARGDIVLSMSEVRRSGDYLVAQIHWDADLTASMSGESVLNLVRQYAKGQSGHKYPRDLGNIGAVSVLSCDAEAGHATVQFRSSEARAFPPVVLDSSSGVELDAALED